MTRASGGLRLQKHATSIALIVAAIGVGAYAYFVDRGSITQGERQRRENDVFPAYRREDLRRIELAQAGATLVLERDLQADGGDVAWRMTSPRTEQADASAVDKLLGAIEFASIVRKVDPASASGLDAPRVRGTLDMGRLVYHFALGGPATTPAGAAYLRVDGEGVYVVSRELATELAKGPDAYRTRTVVPYLSIDLAKLEVTGGAGGFTVERTDSTNFRLQGLGLRASRDGLDRVWSAFAEMRAESFLDDATADQAAASPAFTIRMTPKEGAKPAGELLLGEACPGHSEDVVVVRKAPSRVSACVPRGVLEGLSATRESLVDRRLFGAHADEIEEIVLESVPPGARVELARKGSGWHERVPRDHDLGGDEVDAANALVGALARGEGSNVEHAGVPVPSRARVTITRVEGGGQEIVELGPPAADGGALVHRLADDAVMRVPPELARKLLPTEIAVRAHDLFAPPLEGRAPTRIATRCDGVVQELVRDKSAWTFRDPKGLPADGATATGIADAVIHAKADAWVADADDGTFGFDKSSCSVTVGFEDDAGTRTVTLVFGREGEGGVYGHVAGESAVFVAPKTLRAAVPRWAIDRTAFRVDPATIASVTLARGSRTVLLTRTGVELSLPDGGPPDLAARIRDALQSLHADEAIHPGPARAEEGLAQPALDVRVRLDLDGGTRDVHFVVGRAAVRQDQKVYYARVDGIDASFTLAEDRIAPLLEAF